MACAQKSKIDVTLSDPYLGLMYTIIVLALAHLGYNTYRFVNRKTQSRRGDLLYSIISGVVLLVVMGTCIGLIAASEQVTVANS